MEIDSVAKWCKPPYPRIVCVPNLRRLSHLVSPRERDDVRAGASAQYGRTIVPSLGSWDDAYEDIVITGEDERTVEYAGIVVWFQPVEEKE